MIGNFGIWDLALWFVVAFVAVNLLLRAMIRFRAVLLARYRAQAEEASKRAQEEGAEENARKAETPSGNPKR